MAEGKSVRKSEKSVPYSYPPAAEYQRASPRQVYPPPSQQGYPTRQSYPSRQSYTSRQSYPPPQVYESNPAYPQAMYQAPPITITNDYVNTIFKRWPVSASCSNCKTTVTTRVDSEMGCMVWLMFFVFLIISPCYSCFPFCIDDYYDATHYCPRCSRELGFYSVI